MGYHHGSGSQTNCHRRSMQTIAPTRSLNRRSRDLLMVAALVFLLGAAMLALGFGLHVISLVVPYNQGYGVYDLLRKALLPLGASLALLSLGLALRAITWKTDSKHARQLGEKLAGQLDHRYVLIRGISKRTTGYIDGALVSPHGVLALRISDRRGEFFNEGGDWLRLRRGKWQPMRWNPTREAIASASRLRAHLKLSGLPDAPVFAAVVFLRDAPELRLRLRQPALPVVHAAQLAPGLRQGYFAAQRVSADEVRALVRAIYE